MKTIRIAAEGVTPYEVVIGYGLLEDAVVQVGPWTRRPRIAVVSDETVADIHGSRVLEALTRAGIEADLLAIPPGEGSKSMGMLTGVLDQLFRLDARACERLEDARAMDVRDRLVRNDRDPGPPHPRSDLDDRILQQPVADHHLVRRDAVGGDPDRLHAALRA